MDEMQEVTQLIGKYTATVMVENPYWVFNPEPALQLAKEICQLFPQGEPPLLSPTEMGDLLDLDSDYEYPCSDGSITITLDVRPIRQAQCDLMLRWMRGE